MAVSIQMTLSLALIFMVISGQVLCEEQTNVTKVHIIFMNHLDVGYDGISPRTGFINNVLNSYFSSYFPQAWKLGQALKEGQYLERFIYTTHPWLVSLYTDCPPNLVLSGIKLKCPTAEELGNFTEAVKQGVITWHAGPMNMQIENMDENLLRLSIQLSFHLDKKFGITRNFPVLSQRDVPGITHAALPTLVDLGVKAVTVGVNSGTAPPAVPRVFRWSYSNSEVYATWHPGGYPDNAGDSPAHPGGLSRDNCAVVPGFPEALCFAFRTDNSGPPQSVQELLGYYEILRVQFPGAQLQASTLETYFAALHAAQPPLPTITQEIGDTWIQGVASDPRKMAEMRVLTRVMASCFAEGGCSLGDEKVLNAIRFLIKMPEHTWGLPSVNDNVNWANEDFYRVRHYWNFRKCSMAWQEQREFVNLTLEALEGHPIHGDMLRELQATRPQEPNLTGFKQVKLNSVFRCSQTATVMTFHPSGALDDLTFEGVRLGSGENLFGQFVYQTFTEDDFNQFASHYEYGSWNPGFSKVNLTLYAQPEHRIWPTVMDSLYVNTSNPCDVYVHISMVDQKPVQYYGAPQDIWVRYTYVNTSKPRMDIDFQWFGKTSTRLPEALYFSLYPPGGSMYKWLLNKVGQIVDPLNVVLNGSQFLHAVDSGIYLVDPQRGLGINITSVDVPLVSLATASQPELRVLPVPLSPISNITGLAFNLFNNAWDTNYIFWYPYLPNDDSFRARFSLEQFRLSRPTSAKLQFKETKSKEHFTMKQPNVIKSNEKLKSTKSHNMI